MNKFYLYIFILLCFIFAISYYNAYCSSYYANNYDNFTNSGDITNITENFSQKNGGNSDNSKNSISNSTIVLLGDSMLKNNFLFFKCNYPYVDFIIINKNKKQ